MTPRELLDLPLPPNDSGALTVRGYLTVLLAKVWRETESFSGKKPFGSSGWRNVIYSAMIKAGAMPGLIDDGIADWTWIAEKRADELILAAIAALGETPEGQP